MQHSRLLALPVLAAFLIYVVGCAGSTPSGTSLVPASQTTQARNAQAATPRAANPTQSIPITGTAPNSTFSGTFSVAKFVTQGRALYAVGTLAGTLTNTVSGVRQTVNQTAQLPVTSANGTCQILNLTLGPVDLNLLGLMVHLNQVVLTITAQSGPGNLLGNLLCAVANLLNPGGAPLGALANLLNRILGILQGL